MPTLTANGIDLYYESFGAETAPVVLQIMGFGSQITRYPLNFAEGIAARGYRYLRFDNRDIGLSQKLSHLPTVNIAELMGKRMAGLPVEVPYGLDDMADDAAGLLAALDIHEAHIMGESMGGMIAQIFAARHPARASSLTSVMSSSGRPGLPQATAEVAAALFARPKDASDREEILDMATHTRMLLAGPAFNPGADYQRREAEASMRRSVHPDGRARHLAAVIAGGSREALLKELDLPALVLHGRDDTLLPLACGEDTAKLIPGAELKIVDGMSHAIEPDLAPILVEIVCDFFDRAGDRGVGG